MEERVGTARMILPRVTTGSARLAHPTKRAEQNSENRRCRIAPTALA